LSQDGSQLNDFDPQLSFSLFTITYFFGTVHNFGTSGRFLEQTVIWGMNKPLIRILSTAHPSEKDPYIHTTIITIYQTSHYHNN